VLALRAGLRDHYSITADPVRRLRSSVLGERAGGPPRVLVRVDEFPNARAHDDPEQLGTDAFAAFHEVLAQAGVPYLVAVLPRVARDFLNPEGGEDEPLTAGELAMLGRMRDAGVAFALHGHSHRTRHAHPRRHSALAGLQPAALEAALDSAHATLAPLGIDPRVFVPPFNRFDATQYPLLARRYDVVCGGPESVRAMGLQPGPCWIGDAVWFPSYAPVYGRAGAVAAEIDRLVAARTATWTAVTLHPGWELDDRLEGLKLLAGKIAPLAEPWDRFLDAVRASS
jgi:hypothetical protein